MGALRRIWDAGHDLRHRMGIRSESPACPGRLRRAWHDFADVMIALMER